VPSTFGIALGLIQAVTGRKAFFLGLDERQGDWLCVDIHLDPKDIVDLPARASPCLAVDDFYRARRLFTPDQVFRPTAPV